MTLSRYDATEKECEHCDADARVGVVLHEPTCPTWEAESLDQEN